MEQKYKQFIQILILFLIMDFITIGFINNSLYKDQFNLINIGTVSDTLFNKIIYGTITYFLMTFGLYYFIIKDKKNIYSAMLLGLIIYGIYNGTNIITINSYKLKVAIIDTIWGMTLFGLTTYLIYKFDNIQ